MKALQPGTTLKNGKYTINKILGQGSFGITYLAATKIPINIANIQICSSSCNVKSKWFAPANVGVMRIGWYFFSSVSSGIKNTNSLSCRIESNETGCCVHI